MKGDVSKGGYDPKNPSKGLEYNKFRLMEEANAKLKSELDDAYRAFDEKENTIQKNKMDVVTLALSGHNFLLFIAQRGRKIKEASREAQRGEKQYDGRE